MVKNIMCSEFNLQSNPCEFDLDGAMADLESLDLSLSEFLSLSLDLDEKMEGLEDLLGDSVAAVSAAADPPPDSIVAVEGSPSEVNNIFCAFCDRFFAGKCEKIENYQALNTYIFQTGKFLR